MINEMTHPFSFTLIKADALIHRVFGYLEQATQLVIWYRFFAQHSAQKYS